MRLLTVSIMMLTGCSFQGEGPVSARVRCQANADCPNAGKCLPLGFCAQVDASALIKRIEPSIAGLGQTVRLTLEFETSRQTPPTVWAFTAVTQEEATLTTRTDLTFVYEWVVPPLTGIEQGVFVADFSPTQRAIELGTVAIDSKPPSLQLSMLLLTPPSAELLGTGLRSIRKVTNATEVEFVVRSDEPLAQAPTPSFVLGAERIPVPLISTNQTNEWRFSGNVGQVQALTSIQVQASAQDTQGNASELTLIELEVDTQPPRRPDVDQPDAIVFRRAPKGTLDSPGMPDFSLSAIAGSLEPNALVILSSGSGVFGRVKSTADGGLNNTRLNLRDDLDTISLQLADEAGNLSDETRVRDVDVRIFTDAKAVSFDFVHSIGPGAPMTLYANRPSGPVAALPPVARASPAVLILRELVERWPSRAEGQQSSFTLFESTCNPRFNQKVSAAFWFETGVNFGESACTTSRGTHWGRSLPAILVLDYLGSRRVDVSPDVSFVAGAFGVGLEGFFATSELSSFRPLNTTLGRRHAAAAMDRVRDEVVLFGGESLDGGVLGDTWRMPYRGELSQVITSGRTPPARKHAAFAYHPGLGKVVLHGGNDGSRTLSDTWLWDGTQWEELPHRQPLAREQHDMIYSYGRASTIISGGVRDGAESPQMAALVDAEWVSPKVQMGVTIPASCSNQGVARAYVTDSGFEAVCPLPDGGFAFSATDGGITKRIPYVAWANEQPPYFYNFRIERTNRFGLTIVSSDFPEAELSILTRNDDDWIEATNRNGRVFTGTCFIWQGEFACNDGRFVMLSNDAVVALPSTSLQVIAAHVWPMPTGGWIADRTTSDSRTNRYLVSLNGSLRELPGNFTQIASVAFAGAPTGEFFVMLRRPDGSDTTDTEVFNGTEWVRSLAATRANLFAMTQPVESAPGRFFTFNFGHLFGSGDFTSAVSPARYELITRGIRPTLQTSLPRVPKECETLSKVEVEAEGSGMAGGVPGFGVHMWDGYWFNPTPAVTVEPGMTRAKATHRNPGAAYRFGFSLDTPPDLETQPADVRFSTIGASRGALDGELQISAFQTRYVCRRSRQEP